MLRYFLLTALVFALTACDGQENSVANTGEVTESLTYFKDQHGNCFAALNSRTYYGYRVTSIAAVPCERTPQ